MMKNLPKIIPNCVVALTWHLYDAQGEALDVLEDPVEFLLGSDDLLPKIDQSLLGQTLQSQVTIRLEPHEAFGDYDEMLLFLEPRILFYPELEVGMIFEPSMLPKGCNSSIPLNRLFMVTHVYPDHVILDGNHPLAGMTLKLELKVHGIREPSQEEISAGTCGVRFFKFQAKVGGVVYDEGSETLRDKNHLHTDHHTLH